MKVSPDFVVRFVMGEYIIVPVGSNATQFNGIISTNSTGAFLWEQLQSETTKEELIKKLTDEFEVDESDAQEDVEAFVAELEKHGILK